MIDGVLPIDKAPGMTSHDVVAIARKVLGTKKIGHCGTLDPMATGLLLLTLGKGTKIQDLIMSEDKEITETREVPEFTQEQIEAAFAKYDGDFYQTPPMVSAIKKDGVALYKLARQGKTVEREPRFVHIYAHHILGMKLPEVDFRVVCSKGFYVRTYAFDIGNDLGCGAHLSALRRTKSGRFDVTMAFPAADLKTASREAILEKLLTLPQVSRLRGA